MRAVWREMDPWSRGGPLFDQTYFKDGLREQAATAGGHPVVTVKLQTGDEYLVRDVVQSMPGIVMLNVYPPREIGGVQAASTSAYSSAPPAGYHPIAIAYEMISCVILSSTTAQDHPQVGFHGTDHPQVGFHGT